MKKNQSFTHYGILCLFLTIFNYSFNQITVTSGLTPLQYVQDHLVGSGVIVSNVTFTGNSNQIATYDGSASNIGFSSGIVLSTGNVNDLSGLDDDEMGTGLSDPDLLAIAQSVTSNPEAAFISGTYDVATLEFDFVPESDIVSFNFVFGSEEYEQWENSMYNDIFGFFVSGPGITGPYVSPAGFPNGSINLALVPGTNLPITISTIYADLNSQYYINNDGGTTINLKGFTVPIPITFNVQCGQTYHFKFAVADCQDATLSTAVFLEDDSFISTLPPINLTFENDMNLDNIPEACIDANLILTRSACQTSTPLSINYTVSGTATQGQDFTLSTGSPILMDVGQNSTIINITPIADEISEGVETIIITVSYIDNNGNPQSISGSLNLKDYTPGEIPLCGCTDPTAANYNANFIYSDGLCSYPEPTILTPNVFSPNGDGINDLFFLTTQNASSVDLTILNRWGNIIYESSGTNPEWNGKLENNKPISDGVYFYKYVVHGLSDKTLEGHGFFHLVK
ncbi:MAG: choice-of-anchor L domain-containing protein [Flavobacteriia bacterium]|nr:choice-of-anchor L domain-containing protein [Flavobacteriia bacterium]